MAGMKQGDVYLVDLDPQHRTETGKLRPALIISIDEMNDHAPRVIIAPITSNVSRVYGSEMLLPITGGLNKVSKVMLNQLRSIDKGRLKERLGQVDRPALRSACDLAIKLITPPKE
jgi:mRNA interferase MazF